MVEQTSACEVPVFKIEILDARTAKIKNLFTLPYSHKSERESLLEIQFGYCLGTKSIPITKPWWSSDQVCA